MCRHENKKFIFAILVWRENEFFMTIILLRASKEVAFDWYLVLYIPSIHHNVEQTKIRNEIKQTMEHLETWRITLREIVAVCLIKIFEQKLEFYRKLKSSIFGMKIQIT